MPRLTVPPNFIGETRGESGAGGIGIVITLSTTGFENFLFADSSFSYSRLT